MERLWFSLKHRAGFKIPTKIAAEAGLPPKDKVSVTRTSLKIIENQPRWNDEGSCKGARRVLAVGNSGLCVCGHRHSCRVWRESRRLFLDPKAPSLPPTTSLDQEFPHKPQGLL